MTVGAGLQFNASINGAANGPEITVGAGNVTVGDLSEGMTARDLGIRGTAAGTLNGILDEAKSVAEKATAVGRAAKPIAEALAPVVEKLAVAALWVGRLWLGA